MLLIYKHSMNTQGAAEVEFGYAISPIKAHPARVHLAGGEDVLN